MRFAALVMEHHRDVRRPREVGGHHHVAGRNERGRARVVPRDAGEVELGSPVVPPLRRVLWLVISEQSPFFRVFRQESETALSRRGTTGGKARAVGGTAGTEQEGKGQKERGFHGAGNFPIDSRHPPGWQGAAIRGADIFVRLDDGKRKRRASRFHFRRASTSGQNAHSPYFAHHSQCHPEAFPPLPLMANAV